MVFYLDGKMTRLILLVLFMLAGLQLSGCSVISAVATSNRMEDARTANIGKQLVPKDGQTYLIPIGTETISYLGSGDTDFKINTTAFTQPKGTYSIIKADPGTYVVYANKRVAGGGETTATIEVKIGEAACFYIFNPISAPARIELGKNDVCDPFLRPLKNQNVISAIATGSQGSTTPSMVVPGVIKETVSPSSAAQSNPAKRLDDLNNMLKKGLISPNDYNTKKAEILKTL